MHDVIATLRASANDVDDTAGYFEIPVEHVRACVRYYADHRDEVDAYAAAVDAAAKREHEAWLREQAVLAG